MFGSKLRYVGGSLHSIQDSKRRCDSSLLKGTCTWVDAKPITVKVIPDITRIFAINFLSVNKSIFRSQLNQVHYLILTKI